MTDRRQRDGTLLTIEKVLGLKAVSLFEAIAEQDLVEIAYIAREEEYPAGQRIITAGELGTAMFVVTRGSVRVHIGDRTIATLGKNEVVGELATLDPEPRSADVTAIDDVQVLRIEAGALHDLMLEHWPVTLGIIQVLCRRLRNTGRAVTVPEGGGLVAPRSTRVVVPQ